VSTSTGWTLDDAGAIDIPRLQHLRRYWDRRPPAHVSLHQIAVFLGAIKPTKTPSGPEQPGQSDSLAGLLEQFPAIPPPEDVNLEQLSVEQRKALAIRMHFGDVLDGIPKATP